MQLLCLYISCSNLNFDPLLISEVTFLYFFQMFAKFVTLKKDSSQKSHMAGIGMTCEWL